MERALQVYGKEIDTLVMVGCEGTIQSSLRLNELLLNSTFGKEPGLTLVSSDYLNYCRWVFPIDDSVLEKND